ncbi:hypothetical protein CBF23_003510 [Marinomonas agarivorans]|nr:hypothetical protein CBF23_003510 [Marinomonas agarivorans]
MDRKNLRKWLKRASSNTAKNSALALIVSVLLTGCFGQNTKPSTASKPERTPDWVLNPPSDSRYIYGVGSAEKFEDLVQSTTLARRQANADIASQLRITVSQSNIQNTEVTSGTGRSEQVLSSMASQTRVDTEALALEQSETVESQAVGRYVYVLQRLDRARVVASLRQEIDELDAKFATIVADVDTTNVDTADLINQWRAMLPALPLLAERTQAVNLLKLYSKTVVNKPKSAQILAFEKQLDRLLVALAIQVESQVPGTTSLVQNVRSGLTDKGLTPSSAEVLQNRKAPLKLMLHATATVEKQKDRTYVFLTVNAALQQTVNNDNAMLANWSLTERGVSAIASQAQLAAQGKIADKLTEQIFAYLTKASE